MKLAKAILLIMAFSVILVSSRKGTSTRNQSKAQAWIRPLIKTAKSYISFANLAYCKPDIVNALGCPLCGDILDKSFKVFRSQFIEFETKKYQYVILVSANHNEVVITFGGPKSSDSNFYGSIYQSGFGDLHGEQIENAFLNVYKSVIGVRIKEDLNALLQQTPETKNYNYVLLGHSFGGSMAVIAAFDLITSQIIPQAPLKNSPLVYSYGQLRVGNDKFVEKVNKMFKVLRIVKAGDHMTRVNNCTWSPSIKQWRCFRDTYQLFLRYPEYRSYITDYSGQANFQNYQARATLASPKNFLQRSMKKKGIYYSANNPGHQVYSYGSTLNNGSSAYGNVYYSQPLGSEVLFSNNFKRLQICNYYKGIPDCEHQLPQTFNGKSHAQYFNNNVEQC